MKNKLFLEIDRMRPELIDMSDYIFDNPELAFKEIKAVKSLTQYLERNGFYVECGLGSLDTAFRAVYENGTGGPTIGLLCEYDALEGLGHGCAHHMQGPSILGAAVAIKECIKEKPFKLVVYGTPGEEGGGGKIIMLREGYLSDIDLALMMHGGPATQTDVKSLAASSINVTFHGKSAHAALKPELGRSALDALLLTFQGVEFLREHVLEDTRMHYTVSDAGGPCNVVPGKTVGSFMLRSYNSIYLKEVTRRFERIVEGAALMTDTTYEIETEKTLESKIPVYKLNELLMNNAELVDAPVRKPAREKTGSTDFGNVTYILPGACIRVAFVDENVSSHSYDFIHEGKTERAHKAVIIAAKILAGTAFDLVHSPNLVKEIQNEFSRTKEKMNIF
ncbi:M20 family metallopeptidase [Geosporobacter ferrireducens]|uniref:Peptidase M20 domain-containing protein 2 n=1 Tax=Geosporobacter ferrireducens TaxID=1424294 RepID=A0A1D8GNU5_9FIRM|nr:M20 family metallopeptidase [Geosporobacter ferrireducens]AOT72545.1 amidohydrolase [Geosporobacter ferrireducens]